MIKRLKKTSAHDVDTREYAILYINGEFLEGHTHSSCLRTYLDRNKIDYDDYELTRSRSTVNNTMGDSDISEYAFLHYVDGEQTCCEENTGIYIETGNVSGISIPDLVQKIKSEYPNEDVYDDAKLIYEDLYKIEYEKLAKKAYIDTREYVIPITPDYPQDYFLQRDPARLKKIKELHDNNQYRTFEDLVKPTMTAGLAMDKVNRMPGDTVVVYHGTSASFIDDILRDGLSEKYENSYQSHGASYGLGIWVTLNYDGALNYAKHSARGWTKDNSGSEDENITQYYNYGAVFEIELNKDEVNDEGSASNNNLKSNDIIPANKIKQIYVFDIETGETWNYY